MMLDIRMPQLGESVTEGTLSKWLKAVGDPVAKYEPLVEVVTDKVNAEIPSDEAGILTEIVVNEGDTVPVGTVIARLRTDQPGGAPGAAAAVDQSVQAEPVHPHDATADLPVSAPLVGSVSAVARYSPAVLRLAQDNQVDLTQVAGSGEGGRITRKDVQNFIEARANQPADAGLAQKAPTPIELGATVGKIGAVVGSREDEEIIHPSAVRKTIAARMVESKRSAPHAWMMVEVDVSKLVLLRDVVKSEFKRREGIDLTYLPFFIKATVDALKQYPMLNSSWDGDVIRVKKRIHISVAVATDEALMVPVIHDADRLSVAGLAHAVNDLAARARSGRLAHTDVQGGTFTINNTGAFGSMLSQPIINYPQAAILSVEAIMKRPIVVDDAIAIRSMVNLCLSVDHRILDGLMVGQFLSAIKERLAMYDRDTVIY